MATGKDKINQEYKNWLRLTTLIDFAGRNLCYNVLFNKEKLPSDGLQLSNELKPLKSKICQFKSQQEILCPPSGITDHQKFDLTLFTSIIKVKFSNKYNSLVDDLRLARNREFHRGSKEISDTEFNQLWKDTTDMLVKHNFNLPLVDGLKSCDPLSHQEFKNIAYLILQGSINIFPLL